MDPRKLARNYEREVVPHWDELFVPFLLEVFPQQLSPKIRLLEMGCTAGKLTEEVVRRLPPSGRLIAIDDNQDLIELARKKVAQAVRRQVFFKQERADQLSFADHTFNGIISCGLPAAFDLGAIIQEAGRLLEKDGFLLMGFPLQGSFQELFDIFREVLEKEDLIEVQEGLDRVFARAPDRQNAMRLLIKAGFLDCRVEVREAVAHFPDGLSLVGSALVRQHCLDECVSLIKDRSWREGVLAGIIRTLDTYFPQGIELTLIFGRLEGVRI
jgi:SAM-dependent methyltransferase